jgi:hypothetical protein
VPAHAAAKRLLPILPSPMHPDLHVEHAFRLLLPPGAARGYIDLLIPQPVLKYMPTGDWSPKRPVVIDHKTTSNLFYAKTSEELRTDPQAILYGLEARVHVSRERKQKVSDIPEVDLQWGYTSTRGPAEVRPVRLRQSLPILEDGLGPLLDDARAMAAGLAHGVTKDLEYDLRACEAFGGCPYRLRCDAYKNYQNGSTPSRTTDGAYASTMTSALLAKLQKASQSAPKAKPEDVPPAAVSTPAPEPTTETHDVKPSPEPALPKPDTTGLDVKPTEPVAINSPEAAPDVSPEDPPVPGEVATSTPKKRVGRPKKAPAPFPTEVIDAEFDVSARSGAVNEDELKALLLRAVNNGQFSVAQQIIHTIESLDD